MNLEVELYVNTSGNTEKPETKRTSLYRATLNHNLSRMAYEARIYEPLWCPQAVKTAVAKDVIPSLQKGLQLLKTEDTASFFRQFEIKDESGTCEELITFVEKYLIALKKHPQAFIGIAVVADKVEKIKI
jgi:hypothetical protein